MLAFRAHARLRPYNFKISRLVLEHLAEHQLW